LPLVASMIVLFSHVHHVHANAIFDGTSWVHELAFGIESSFRIRYDAIQAYDWCIANGLQNVVVSFFGE
jgi:hypothetical protein